jgi:hypothetical protein
MTESPQVGAHLVSPRTGYTHHGLYVGNGKVIHYAGFGDGPHSGPVEQTTLARFQSGHGFRVRKHRHAPFKGRMSVERARSRIGENVYCLFSNNCEHFVNWCIDGDHASAQVDIGAAASGPTAGTVLGLGARAGVSAAGPVTGLSGAGAMGGLAEIGAVVGGSTVAGIAIVGAAGGAATASLINCTLLKDNPAHDRKERNSRSVGRKATYAGAAAGTAGSVAAISAMGTTAGLSAAGITSGLAAIGGTVGGGMAAGIAVTAAAPAVAAAAVGYGIYKLVKCFSD